MKKLIVLFAAMVTFVTSSFAQLGSATSDLVYTPVTPCRVFDTRPSQGGSGPIAAAGTKDFTIWGVSSYAGQGGSSSNCGITAGINTAAVALNVTVVTPAAGGFVAAYPFGTARPTSATVNFQTGDIARGNFTIAKVSQSVSTQDLTVYSTSNADVVGDVVGYYAMPVKASLSCSYTPTYETVSLPAGTTTYTYTTSICPANSIAVSSYCFNNNNPNVYLTGSGVNNGAWCGWRNLNGAAVNVLQNSFCCSMPGR